MVIEQRVLGVRQTIRHMNRSPFKESSSGDRTSPRRDRMINSMLYESIGSIVRRYHVQRIIVKHEDQREFCSAESARGLDDGVKYRLELKG